MSLLQVYLIFFGLLVFWEDLRHRAVHWSLFAQAFLCLGVFGLLTEGHHAFITETPVNMVFVVLQFAGVAIYCSLRERRWVNPLRDRIGLGDPLFLLACTLAFPRYVFVLFVISGIVFALLGYLLLRVLMPRQPATVPTAGFLGLYLGTWMAMRLVGMLDTKALNLWLAHA